LQKKIKHYFGNQILQNFVRIKFLRKSDENEAVCVIKGAQEWREVS